jgi:hypothetical protein
MTLQYTSHGIETLALAIALMLNKVFFLGFPPSWTTYIIHLMDKLGNTSNPHNNVSIMVEHNMVKPYYINMDA